MSIDYLTTPAVMSSQQGPSEHELRGKDMDKAAAQFESYMVEMMVREMRKTVPEGMFHNNAVDLFSGVMDQEISKRVAQGGGLGFARMLTQQEAMPTRAHVPASNSVRMVPRGSVDATAGIHSKAGMEARLRHHHGHGDLPVEGGVVTSHFGHRSDPFHGRKRAHKGMDIAAPTGSPIQPVRPGTVVSAGRRGSYGNVVVVDHGQGFTSLYAHCDELLVKPGDRVAASDVIATVGSTGRSTGPHLHLEIHQDGEAVDPAETLGLSDHNHDSVVRR